MFRSTKNFILPPLPPRVIEKLKNEVRMGDLDYFFENVLPPIQLKLDTDRIFNHCIKNEILTKDPQSESYTWKLIPKDMRNFDHRAYVDPFMEISRAIIKAARKTSTSKITRVPFILKDGGKSELSDNDDYPEEELCPYLYFENRNIRFKGRMEDRHWYTSGFGFHFKRSDEDDIDVSAFDSFSHYLY